MAVKHPVDALSENLQTLLEQLRTNGEAVDTSILAEEAASGDAIPKSHLNKIYAWTRKEIDPTSIYTFPVLMIDAAPTRNGVIYTEASQKKSIKKWVGIPYLFNAIGTSGSLFAAGADHTLQSASQIGRIYDARCVKTEKNGVGSLGWVYSVAGSPRTDEFLHLVDTGILREVSIHVTVPEGVECSICNDAFSKCVENSGTQHYPGEKYGSKFCYMSTGTGALGPLELSQVACPGSVSAHIMQDGEVENYPIVSLREALGNSREVTDQIIQQEKEMDETQARVKLTEIATAAGVKLAEAIADPTNKEIVAQANTETWTEAKKKPDNDDDDAPEAANKCEGCGHASHGESKCEAKNCECMGSKQSHDPVAPIVPVAEAAPIALFEGKCPVCLRDGGHTENVGTEGEQVAKIREHFQESVTIVVTEANTKITEALAAKVIAETKAAERDSMFSDLVDVTVQEAIDLGQKAETERTTYRETLAALNYSAVKEIRAAMATAKKTAGTTAGTAQERLVTSMEERFRKQITDTKTETDATTGRTRTVPTRRAGFALK